MDGKTYKTGTIGDIGTSSFYPPHHMTMGEGGAVYTRDPLLHKIIRSFRDWGRDCVCPTYSHFGYNLKATDLQAAIGCAQLEKFPSFVEKRKENFARLRKGLEGLQDKLILPEAVENGNPSWFGFLITCKEGVDRTELVKKIEAANIQTRALFAGNLTRHPCFDQIRGTDAYRVIDDLSVTDRIMRDTFWVGVYPGMTDAMIDRMAKVIKESL